MSGKSGVALLETVVLGEVVHVVAADDEGALHLESADNTLEDAATDGHVRGEGALLVNVVASDSLLGGLEAETDLLVETRSLLGLLGLGSDLLVKGNADLLLVRLLGL